MIPRWQIVVALGAFVAAVVLVVATSPNSYTYAVLTGQCSKQPAPAVCSTSGPRGVRSMHLGH